MKRILSLGAGTVVTFFAMSISSFAASPCGGDGQRACCNGKLEFAQGGGACNVGISYSDVGGCNDEAGCACGSPASGNSPGMCYQAQPCGGEGQRACCNFHSEFASNGLACGDGLVQIANSSSSADPWDWVCGNPIVDGVLIDVNSLGVVGYHSLGICVKPAPCGGLGQRACCIGTLEYAQKSDGSSNGSTCNDGLTMVAGCSGDCTCGGSTSVGESATDSCTKIEAIAEPTTNAIAPGANPPAPGLSWPPYPDETGATGTWKLPAATPPVGLECPSTGLCGYADLHVHMFANLAHGGAFVAGEPWNPNGVNAALGEDFGSSRNLVDKDNNPEPSVDVVYLPTGNAGCPDYLRNNHLCSGQVLFHGNHTLNEVSTGAGTNDGAVGNLGVPLFNSWPLWTSTVHQQVYYKWLERAWLGGLRLMVMDAVSNESLCKNAAKVSGEDCSLSMNDIDNQLLAAQSFQTWLDTQYGGPGKGWFQIVTTPNQAQSVIGQGKLAVVLGIEVDNIFNCHKQKPDGTPFNGEGPTCDDTYVKQQLQKYYAMGVRHIFPIHDFDNAFGTTATWQDAINAGNRVGEGDWQHAVNCTDPGYGFSFDATTESFILLAGFGIDDVPRIYPAFTSGSCSEGTGISPLGTNMIQQAMNLGFIIDVDHMSVNGFFNTLQQATSQYPAPYAGIVASHVQFFDLYQQHYGTTNYGRHERMRTYAQLQRIAQVGGMIGVMLKDDAQDTGNGWCLPQGKCFPLIGGKIGSLGEKGPDFTLNYNGPNHPSNNDYALNQNCLYSTTETAQQYLYGVKAMNGVGVALGSDFMGIAGHPGPRFGNGACGGHADQRAEQERAQLQSKLWNLPGGRLTYPFTLPGFGTFDKQVSGQKTYDFNVDGLAHIGLLPDMVADLMNVGVDVQQLQPLFASAQAYINMWSKVYKNAPVTTDSITTGTGAASPFSSAGLAQGQEMDSPNGRFRATMQTDGNFVIYDRGSAIWATGTQGKGRQPYRLAVQPDGNLVIYGSSANDVSLPGYGVCSANWACIATWGSGTQGSGSAPYTLKMQDDGNLVLYDSTSRAVWASGTQR